MWSIVLQAAVAVLAPALARFAAEAFAALAANMESRGLSRSVTQAALLTYAAVAVAEVERALPGAHHAIKRDEAFAMIARWVVLHGGTPCDSVINTAMELGVQLVKAKERVASRL